MLISPPTNLSADPAGWLGADDLVMLVAHDEASTLAINRARLACQLGPGARAGRADRLHGWECVPGYSHLDCCCVR
jgi:hypothetical protein